MDDLVKANAIGTHRTRTPSTIAAQQLACAAIALSVLAATAIAQETRPAEPLPTGRTFEAGLAASSQEVGSLPINMAMSPDGSFAVTTDAGFRESIWSLSTADGHGVSSVAYQRSKTDSANGLYYGLTFAPDGTLYAAQGAASRVAVLHLNDKGELSEERTIDTGPGSFPAGVALDRAACSISLTTTLKRRGPMRRRAGRQRRGMRRRSRASGHSGRQDRWA